MVATRENTMRIKVIIEHSEDTYVAYPLGTKGIVVGQGDSYDEALADVSSAIRAHVERFGHDTLIGFHGL